MMRFLDFKIITLFFCSCLLLSASCKKKSVAPVDQLPAATQTGANTFGCLVNGQAFIPSGSIFSSPYLQCNYIYMNGGFYFTLSGRRNVADNNLQSILLFTTNLAIKEGLTLKLENYNENGKAAGEQFLAYGYGQTDSYQTTTAITGELHITKFDDVKQIVSGTFFFDAINPAGDIVHVTNGRFDMPFTN